MLKVADGCCTDEGTRGKIKPPGWREKIRKEKRKTNSRKQGTKSSTQEDRTQGVSIATIFPVSAPKPRRGPCHTICHLLPALVSNGIKYHCSSPPSSPRTYQRKTQTKLAGLGGCSNSGFTYSSNRYVATRSTISFLHSSRAVSVRIPPLSPLPLPLSSPLASSVAWRGQLLSASSLCHYVMQHFADSTTTSHPS